MRRYVVLLLTGIFWAVALEARQSYSFFQPFSWEQANLVAAKENKLVLVEVGLPGEGMDGILEKHRELSDYLLRNVVAVRIDMTSPAGKEFEERLLLYTPPLCAFFMPYGDLVGVVSFEEIERNVEVLREILQQARQAALIKKNNSRSVSFVDLDLEQALALAAAEDKNLFVYIRDSRGQPSLLVEKNVMNLDQVADFFHRHFVNLSLDKNLADKVLERYPVRHFPAYLFLNSRGKLLYRAEGYGSAEQLIGYGDAALEKAKGILFEPLDIGEAGMKASQSGKLIFTDHYVAGNRHRELQRTVFSDPEVADVFAAHFVNVSREDNQDFLQFTDASGRELHRVLSVVDAEDLLRQAQMALAGCGVAGMAEEYRQGNRNAGFMEKYLVVLDRAGRSEEVSQVAMEYLSLFGPSCLKEKQYWDLFDQYVRKAVPSFFDYVLRRRAELAGLYGEEEVDRKVIGLCMAGTEDFVLDGYFDEAAFKEYVKRLKKEKVEGWRQIARDARMLVSEQIGDWKTFIILAEEKWNEEQLPDVELYRWGMKIDANCQDDGVRYKMAQWLADRVLQIRRQEQSGGKIKMDSYRGFFEKLVDDLLKKQ